MAVDALPRLSELIAMAARDHARMSPPPRGIPFFALDHRSGSAIGLLDALASHGIFRKYERVLDLSAHLGMTSRWLATKLGCTAVATAPSHAQAAAGHALTRSAGLENQVHHVTSDGGMLPFESAGFTHVWSIEALAFLPDPVAALAEAHRVLRPGGHLAVQELVCAGPQAPAVPAATFRDVASWERLLARAGFVDLVVRDVSAQVPEPRALLASSRARLERVMQDAARSDAGLAMLSRQRAEISACLASSRLGLAQILGRRP